MLQTMSDTETDLFLALSPEVVLQAVEAGGLSCKPVCFPLNSFENRVYLMELEDDTRIVSKFYRPRRWSREQILEEHQFLSDLAEDDVPVCPTLPFPDGETLKETRGIKYCLFEGRGGRAPEDLTDEDVERMGMLVARMHNVAVRRTAEHRIHLTAETYVWDNLAWLEEHDVLPAQLATRYLDAATYIANVAEECYRGIDVHRIHGDFHLGNLLLRDGVFNVLDFDDMVVGPPVQDLWLALPGRDEHTLRQREAFLEGYERFRSFDRSTLALIEPLRGLRMIHYATWLARRWHDPIFPRTWPHFGTEEYWEEETGSLEDLVTFIQTDRGEASPVEEVPALTNKDYFWDWEGD
jgi:Ser/Thr protein kinase RdoA (MazF antagonist)